ncbi:LysR family transcriptional regulator [Pandoraea terrae]|uniref:LysR family transcriptional regulator n=1 Tax=Pandoraea terrae TaxID=1537710 RepID=A0A5E4TRS0_9BURK|nr:LysR family transcriptional regulator [Pandoraea terrae]VVD90565.1 LysR family transcriptional regulator [Pandoraea terrae]
MNLRFLETFVWLAKLKNFRLTAERLHTTQAAVSSRIASLEQGFGVRLFDRSAREVTLTASGQKALAYAERIVKLGHEMKRELADADVRPSLLHIGVIESIVHSWFPDLAARIHREYPKLEIELTSETTINLCKQLEAGSLDLILQTDVIETTGIENVSLAEFPMRWVGSPKLNLEGETLSLADLAAYPLISFSRHSGPHKTVERMFAVAADQPVRVSCMTSVAAMIRLAVDGFGVTVLPPAIIQRELHEHSLQLLRVDANFPNLPLVGSFRTGTPLAENVARLAQQTASEFALNMGPDIAIPPAVSMQAPAWGTQDA